MGYIGREQCAVISLQRDHPLGDEPLTCQVFLLGKHSEEHLAPHQTIPSQPPPAQDHRQTHRRKIDPVPAEKVPTDGGERCLKSHRRQRETDRQQVGP